MKIQGDHDRSACGLIIRPEQPRDHDSIGEVNRLAFGGEQEARLVERIRDASGFEPALSLVAERDNEIVGHVLFSPIRIDTDSEAVPALALAPMAVRPECQRQGIGSALGREGLEVARRLGHRIVVVVGHADYYPRFGFRRACEFGIRCPFECPDDSFMVLSLAGDSGVIKPGTVCYPPPFSDL